MPTTIRGNFYNNDTQDMLLTHNGHHRKSPATNYIIINNKQFAMLGKQSFCLTFRQQKSNNLIPLLLPLSIRVHWQNLTLRIEDQS